MNLKKIKLINGWFSQGIMGAKKSWHKVIG